MSVVFPLYPRSDAAKLAGLRRDIDDLKKRAVITVAAGAGGGLDFNKLNDTDAAAANAAYLLAVVDDYQTPPSPYGDYAFQFIDSTPDRSLAPVRRKGFLFQVDPSSSIIHDGGAGIDMNVNANGGFNVSNTGDGGVAIDNTGEGGLSLQDSGLLGGLNITTTALQTGGLNIKNLGVDGMGFVDNYNSTGGGGVEIHSKKNDVNIQTLVAGSVTISAVAEVTLDAAGNIVMGSLPASDPGVSGALWNNSGVMNISP